MPLLYDEVQLRGSVAPDDVDAAEHWFKACPVFEITNVARSVEGTDWPASTVGKAVDDGTTDRLSRTGLFRVKINAEMFPGIVPPFRSYWMDLYLPAVVRRSWKVTRCGLWANVMDKDDPAFFARTGRRSRTGDDGWTIDLSVWLPIPGLSPAEPIWRWTVEIDCDGTIEDPGLPAIPTAPGMLDSDLSLLDDQARARLRDVVCAVRGERRFPLAPDGDKVAWSKRGVRPYGPEFDTTVKPLLDEGKAIDARVRAGTATAADRARADEIVVTLNEWEEHAKGEIVAGWDEYLDDCARVDQCLVHATIFPIWLQAHALLACKNVDTETVVPSDRLSKARRRRHPDKAPLTRYKTLVIRPPKGARHEARRIGLGDGQTAEHIARGHVKHYTADRPLFGKHVGNWYWEQQVRGNPSRGSVVKDYRIDTEEAS